jgi:hypothetical protein
MEGRGEIRLEDGSLAVSAEARYIRLSQEQTEAFQDELGFWQVIEGDEGEEAATEQALRRIDTE